MAARGLGRQETYPTNTPTPTSTPTPIPQPHTTERQYLRKTNMLMAGILSSDPNGMTECGPAAPIHGADAYMFYFYFLFFIIAPIHGAEA
jgi:hypothetical protein